MNKYSIFTASILVILLLSLSGCALADSQSSLSNWIAGRVTHDLLSQTSAEKWLDWIEKLSGAEPVQIGGETTSIQTRFNYAMFSGQENARAAPRPVIVDYPGAYGL